MTRARAILVSERAVNVLPKSCLMHVSHPPSSKITETRNWSTSILLAHRWAHGHTDVCPEHAQSPSWLEPTPAQKDSVSATQLLGICQMFLQNYSKYLMCGSQVFTHQLSARSHKGRINHIVHSHLCW